MQTSYFAHPGVRKLAPEYPDRFVSIARLKPSWWKGGEFSRLAPPASLLRRYRNKRISWEQYRTEYRAQVLAKLDPQAVYTRFKDCILLCYEKPGVNCHRRLVAEWIGETLGIEVSEASVGK